MAEQTVPRQSEEEEGEVKKSPAHERAARIITQAIGPRIRFDEKAEHVAKNVVGLLSLTGLLRSDEECARFEGAVDSYLGPRDTAKAAEFLDREKANG